MENKELEYVISLLNPKQNQEKKKLQLTQKNNNSEFTNLPLIAFGGPNPQAKPKLNISKFNSNRIESYKHLPKFNYNNHPNNFKLNTSKRTHSSDSDRRNNNLMNYTAIETRKKSPPKITPFNLYVRYLNFRPFINLPSKVEESKQNSNKTKYYYRSLGNECPLVKNLLEDNGFIQCNNNDFSIGWSSGHIKLTVYPELTKWQRVNHFPNSRELTRKDLLYKNLSKFISSFPEMSKANFLPKSFLLPNEKKFLEDEMSKNEGSLWIIKPVSSSKGRGIFITNNISEIPSGVSLIASKYISNPLLINKRKFDLRIYVFVTSILPLRIYRYNDGLVRFAADPYSSDINDRCSHLTNYEVNKNNINYIKNDNPYDNTNYYTSKWNLGTLRTYLIKQNINPDVLFDKIDDIAIKTLISCENELLKTTIKNTNYPSNCFELFGFDILFDDLLRPWLMEVNLSPNLHYDAPIDLKIKGEMIAECFDLIRIIPYDLRNESFASNVNFTSFVNSYKCTKKFKINKESKELIWESYEEKKRCKNFNLIFPCENYSSYAKYFDQEREINLILSLMMIEDKEKKERERMVKTHFADILNKKYKLK